MDPEDLRQLYRQHGRSEVLRARGVGAPGHSPCPAEMGQSPLGDGDGAAGARIAAPPAWLSAQVSIFFQGCDQRSLLPLRLFQRATAGGGVGGV